MNAIIPAFRPATHPGNRFQHDGDKSRLAAEASPPSSPIMIGIRIPLGTGEWMLFAIRSLALPLAVGLVLLTLPSMSTAQQAGSGSLQAADRELPAAPEPQFAIAAADESDEAQAPSAQNQNTQQPSSSSIPAAAPGPDGTSQSTPAQPTDEKSQRERAEEQLKQQEHQRVAGVMASFNTTTNRNAL